MVHINETIEGLYYKDQKDADEHDVTKAVGGIKTVNGIFLSEWGKITPFKYVKGSTELKES